MFSKTRKYILFPVPCCCNSTSITFKFPHGMDGYGHNQQNTFLVRQQDRLLAVCRGGPGRELG